MTFLILQILAVYSLIGAVLIFLVGKKKPAQKKQLWVKYIVYMLLIAVVISSMLIGKGYFFELAILISFLGLVEIIKIGTTTQKKPPILPTALGVFGGISTLFIFMAYTATTTYLVSVYFFVIVFDAFSQLSGQLFGKTTITSISPNKTWEGLIGGVVITILSIFLVRWKTASEWPINANTIFFGLLLSATCFFGDLLASWYKRICGTKDYSKILPGQGGILDRYDSLIATGIVFYLTNLFYV